MTEMMARSIRRDPRRDRDVSSETETLVNFSKTRLCHVSRPRRPRPRAQPCNVVSIKLLYLILQGSIQASRWLSTAYGTLCSWASFTYGKHDGTFEWFSLLSRWAWYVNSSSMHWSVWLYIVQLAKALAAPSLRHMFAHVCRKSRFDPRSG